MLKLSGEEALTYDPNPDDSQRLRVLPAAASCPVQAIIIDQFELRAVSTATTIIAADTSVDKFEIARGMGDDEVVISKDVAVQRVLDITGGQGAE